MKPYMLALLAVLSLASVGCQHSKSRLTEGSDAPPARPIVYIDCEPGDVAMNFPEQPYENVCR